MNWYKEGYKEVHARQGYRAEIWGDNGVYVGVVLHSELGDPPLYLVWNTNKDSLKNQLTDFITKKIKEDNK